MTEQTSNIIIYNTTDGKVSVALYAKDGKIWLNQQQMAELFATSKQTISYHIINILKERELPENLVVKDYLTTAADGKNYHVVFYSLEMILAVGYRVRGKGWRQRSKGSTQAVRGETGSNCHFLCQSRRLSAARKYRRRKMISPNISTWM